MSKCKHQWREILPRSRGERTTLVGCTKCGNAEYLSAQATAEFRRQIRIGVEPRFVAKSKTQTGGLLPMSELKLNRKKAK